MTDTEIDDLLASVSTRRCKGCGEDFHSASDEDTCLECRAPEGVEESSPHVTGPVLCEKCNHTWVAVMPVGDRTSEEAIAQTLECPSCGMSTGVFR